MDIFIGIILLILTSVLGLLILTRHGIKLRRFKIDHTEIAVDYKENKSESRSNYSELKLPLPNQNNIFLLENAKSDCEGFTLPIEDVKKYIECEAISHPKMFSTSFSSITLPFKEFIILLSWDSKKILIERIISREEVYPVNNLWNSCLSLYRQAMMLQYRKDGATAFSYPPKLKHTRAHFKILAEEIIKLEKFLDNLSILSSPSFVDQLLQEVDFAIAEQDYSSAVIKMEVLLSNIHKYLLMTIPDGFNTARKNLPLITPKKIEENCFNILFLEDDIKLQNNITEDLSFELDNKKIAVVKVQDVHSAKIALLENYFHVAIVDLNLTISSFKGASGVEAAKSIREASSDTCIIVLSENPEIELIFELKESSYCTRYIGKGNAGSTELLLKTVLQEYDKFKKNLTARIAA